MANTNLKDIISRKESAKGFKLVRKSHRCFDAGPVVCYGQGPYSLHRGQKTSTRQSWRRGCTMVSVRALQTGRVKVKPDFMRARGGAVSQTFRVLFGRQWSEWLPIYVWIIEHPSPIRSPSKSPKDVSSANPASLPRLLQTTSASLFSSPPFLPSLIFTFRPLLSSPPSFSKNLTRTRPGKRLKATERSELWYLGKMIHQ